jgi:hypothetical protein
MKYVFISFFIVRPFHDIFDCDDIGSVTSWWKMFLFSWDRYQLLFHWEIQFFVVIYVIWQLLLKHNISQLDQNINMSVFYSAYNEQILCIY